MLDPHLAHRRDWDRLAAVAFVILVSWLASYGLRACPPPASTRAL
jgi:uncharacterized membrane protein (DUF441 family)